MRIHGWRSIGLAPFLLWILSSPTANADYLEEPSAQASGSTEGSASSAGGQVNPVFYSARPITLGVGVLRVDIGPPDFALLNRAPLQSPIGRAVGYGFTISDPGAGDVGVGLGIGAAYGVIDKLEVGALLLPIQMAPDGDFGDMVLYGRYAFFNKNEFEIAGQVRMQIPTDTDFGLGLGVPVRIHITERLMMDTGAELQFVFSDDALVNLDLPVAISYNITEQFFVGGRTGLFIIDFSDLAIQLGAQGGYSIARSGVPFVDITAWFVWPALLTTLGDDAFHADVWQLGFGANFFFDVPPKTS